MTSVEDEVVEPTRERLVRAARAHLDQHGLDGLSLRAIARRAGVSHGAPLRHFDGVAHLLAAAAAEGFRELHAAVDAGVAEVAEVAGERGRTAERLGGGCRGYARFATASPGVFELMFRHERHAAQSPELQAAGAAAFLQLVGLVEDAQADGWWPGVTPGEGAAIVWSMIHGVVSLWIPGVLQGAVGLTGATVDLDRLVDLAARTLLDASPASREPVSSRSTTSRKQAIA